MTTAASSVREGAAPGSRSPVAYRHVDVVGTKVSGEVTVTDPATSVFPFGEWMPFAVEVSEWWVRLAATHDDTADELAALLGTTKNTALRAFRLADDRTRLACFDVARTMVSVQVAAGVLGCDDRRLEDAANAARVRLSGRWFRKGDRVRGLGRAGWSWPDQPRGVVVRTRSQARSVFVSWGGTCVEDEMEPEELVLDGT